MPTTTDSVQQAHDALLVLTSSAHDSCGLCPSAGSTNSAKEEAHVAETDSTRFSEAQHFALLEAAVERETAELTTAKGELETHVSALETEKAEITAKYSDLEAKYSVLEGEKASAEAAVEAAKQEFADYKAEQERAAEVAARREARVADIRKANASLDDSFFTPERVNRWAEMSDETFAEVAAAFEAGAKVSASSKESTNEQARETAAFTGADEAAPTSDGSTLTSFLGARRRSA